MPSFTRCQVIFAGVRLTKQSVRFLLTGVIFLTGTKIQQGKPPSVPKAGYVFPSMYRTVMYNQTGDYEAQLKVYVRNTWDWITVELRKSDMDYINRRCKNRKQCAPTLQKRGKEWFLDFPFEETVKLNTTNVYDQTVVAVDLGINSAATISVMRSDGTILGRHFCRLNKEIDHLMHSINRIKKAQQHGNYKTPRLWAKAKGVNHDIAVKTAKHIMDIAVCYNADVIVFEHLDKDGKVRGSKNKSLKCGGVRKYSRLSQTKRTDLVCVSVVSAPGEPVSSLMTEVV